MLWTDWGRDWTAQATADAVYRTVNRGLRGGATILLHDNDITAAAGCWRATVAARSWRATVAALPRLLDRCAEIGLRVGPLAEHGLVTGRRYAPATLAPRAVTDRRPQPIRPTAASCDNASTAP